MTRVHGLQHVQRFLATNLADHDSIGTHSEAVDHQLALHHRTFAFDIGRASFQTDTVSLLHL